MRRSFVILIPLGALAWLACGDDYGSDAPPASDPPVEASVPVTVPSAGERGGSCYPNRTCNDALTCIDSLCVLLDAGSPLDDGGDPLAVDANACLWRAQPETRLAPGTFQCGEGQPCTDNPCCIESDQPQCTVNPSDIKCANGRFNCDTNDDCPGKKCCLRLTARSTVDCPLLALVGSSCRGACGVDELPTCTPNEGSCATGQTCVLQTVALGPTSETIAVGMCR